MTTTQIAVPVEVAAALAAVAAIDRTPPEALAGMILADHLASHAEQVHRASDALRRLAGTSVGPAEPTEQDLAWIPEPEDTQERQEPDRTYPCSHDGCEFVADTPQQLGGHATKEHRRPERPAPAPRTALKPEPAPGGPPRCVICQERNRPANFTVDGVLACHRCWIDAGRPPR